MKPLPNESVLIVYHESSSRFLRPTPYERSLFVYKTLQLLKEALSVSFFFFDEA